MAEVLWDRLCPVSIPERYLRFEKRARTSLENGWANLSGKDRRSALSFVSLTNSEMMISLYSLGKEIFQAATSVRGLVILVSYKISPAATKIPTKKTHPPNQWKGAPLIYESISLRDIRKSLN